MTRCASSSLSCWVRVRWVTPDKARCSSLNRLVPPSNSPRIRTFHSPPMTARVVSTAQLTDFLGMGELGYPEGYLVTAKCILVEPIIRAENGNVQLAS